MRDRVQLVLEVRGLRARARRGRRGRYAEPPPLALSLFRYAGFTGVRLGWTVVPKGLKFADGSSVRDDFNRVMCTAFNGASNVVQPGGLACLQAAGFGGVEKDARTGTPYLVMRRLPARTLRALCSQVGVQLLVAEERDAEDEVARLVADSPPTDATAAILAAQAALAAERSAEGDGGSDKPGGPSKEEELVQQISGMISGLISELEGQAGALTCRSRPISIRSASKSSSSSSSCSSSTLIATLPPDFLFCPLYTVAWAPEPSSSCIL